MLYGNSLYYFYNSSTILKLYRNKVAKREKKNRYWKMIGKEGKRRTMKE